jgi:glutamate dehydrogenase
MLALITQLPRTDRWDALARAALRDDLYAALAALTVSVLEVPAAKGAAAADRIAAWEAAGGETWRGHMTWSVR